MKQQILLPGIPLPEPAAPPRSDPADTSPASFGNKAVTAVDMSAASAVPPAVADSADAAPNPSGKVTDEPGRNLPHLWPQRAVPDTEARPADEPHPSPDAPAAAAEAAPEPEDWPPMSQMLQSMFIFEPTTAVPAPITVLGLDCGRPRGLAGLPAYARSLVLEADVICGGRALLEELTGQRCPPDHHPDREHDNAATTDVAAAAPQGTPLSGAAAAALPSHDAAAAPPSVLTARLLPLTTPLENVLARLSQLRAMGERVLVLADGDPLLFGIGATLVRLLGEEAVRLLPAVSSLQQACARLALPWHKVICLSLHGRDDLGPLNAAAGKNAPLCVLTDARTTPDVLARHLLDRGVDWFDAHVFERMGAPDEAVHHLSMAAAAGRNFGPACTLILTPREASRRPCLGLNSEELAVERGLISKKPVRAAALALLRIAPRHVVWDIGAGSGAVALEAAVLAHEGRVVAVERSAGRAMSIQENRRRFGVAILDVRLGEAPECLPALPDPQRVFIGGGLSGEDGEDILGHVCHRLPVGGRVVASCVLLETLCLCRRFFERLGWPVEIEQIAAAEGRPLGGDVHLAAMNPVFLLAAQKPEPGAPAPVRAV